MQGIDKVFKYVRSTSWRDDTPDEAVLALARVALSDILNIGESFARDRVLYRLAGQSGSGKTTQLLPAILAAIAPKKPVVLAVRNFAKYHPKWDDIHAGCEASQMREKTNGFALKLLAAVLELLVRDGYLITMEVTLLATEFEEFVSELLRTHGYSVYFQILAVGKAISERFIAKRKNSGEECGRVVARESINYFYDILPVGLNYWASHSNPMCCVWTAFHKEPIYEGALDGACFALEKGRNMDIEASFNEDELRFAKINYLKCNLR